MAGWGRRHRQGPEHRGSGDLGGHPAPRVDGGASGGIFPLPVCNRCLHWEASGKALLGTAAPAWLEEG